MSTCSALFSALTLVSCAGQQPELSRGQLPEGNQPQAPIRRCRGGCCPDPGLGRWARQASEKGRYFHKGLNILTWPRPVYIIVKLQNGLACCSCGPGCSGAATGSHGGFKLARGAASLTAAYTY